LPVVGYYGGATEESTYETLLKDPRLFEVVKESAIQPIKPSNGFKAVGLFGDIPVKLISSAANFVKNNTIILMGQVLQEYGNKNLDEDAALAKIRGLVTVRDMSDVTGFIVGDAMYSATDMYQVLMTDKDGNIDPTFNIFVTNDLSEEE